MFYLKKYLLSLLACLTVFLMMLPMTVSAEGDVAKIGDTGYATLQDAFDAAVNSQDPVEIELLANVDLTWPVSVSAKKGHPRLKRSYCNCRRQQLRRYR